MSYKRESGRQTGRRTCKMSALLRAKCAGRTLSQASCRIVSLGPPHEGGVGGRRRQTGLAPALDGASGLNGYPDQTCEGR
jgi:hypothetical protein